MLPLRHCVSEVLEHYFTQLEGHRPSDLYRIVIKEIERALLGTVMKEVTNNQTNAAAILGVTRSTLRTKLKQHKML